MIFCKSCGYEGAYLSRLCPVCRKQFELSAGNGEKKQVCEVSFEGENIVITYFSKKTNTELHISNEEEEDFEALEEPSQETQEELSE